MRAVLVFCEGRHDVVFTQRSLGALGDCSWVRKPITELPSPFGRGRTTPRGLIARRFERHALEDHGLQEAAHGDLSSLEHGRWVSTGTVPVGFFVFRKSAQEETGTLENHLAPMAESAWPDRYGKARKFIDTNMDAEDKVSSKDAERLKAIITATGQFNHPGDPMSIIIGRGGLPKEQFETSPLSRELVDFLTRTPWNGA